jgi:glycosyltransferase involved in cell wall biosynthesis
MLDPSIQVSYIAPEGLLPPWRKYGLFLRNFVHALQRIWRGAYDVIHIQTPIDNLLLDLILLACCKMAGRPMVRTVHEVHPAERGRGLSGWKRWWAHLHLRLATHLIVHDTSMQERLCRTLQRAPRSVTVMPHGNYLAFRQYMPSGEQVCQAARVSSRPVVLFFGVKRHKGLEIFLQAWRMVQAEGHQCTALLTGTMYDDDADLGVQAQTLPGLDVHVGYVPNAQLWEYFCRSTLVVMPYLTGTTSGAVHLAYAFKRPVIASDLACFQELVIPGKTGLVVPRGDALALKQAIIQLCQDPALCQQMGEEGFQLVSARRYAWDALAAHTVTAYRQACEAAV